MEQKILRTPKYSAVLVAAALVMASCAADNPEEAPYAAEYATAISEAKSDYVKDMLEDGEITAAEMYDAQGQLESCLAIAGINAFYQDTGYGFESLSFFGEIDDALWPAEQKCRDQWMGNNDYLLQIQITNPQNEDFDSLIAQCLVRKKLVPSGFTGKDYQELHSPYMETLTLEVGEKYVNTSPPEIFLPGGTSLDDPIAATCSINPTR